MTPGTLQMAARARKRMSAFCTGMCAFFVSTITTTAIADIDIYGRAHLSTDYLHDGRDGGFNVSSNSSRLGFRGNTAVTDGLTAIFQLEQTVHLNSGSGTFSTRDSFVGVQGRFGTVRMGFFNTPLKVTRARVDMFSDQLGDNRNLTRVRDNHSGGDYDFDSRFRNGIHYRTPARNNITFDLHYSTNTNTGSTTTNSNDAISTAVTYQTGETYLSAAFERKNDTGSQAVRVAGGQSFGELRIHAFAQQVTVKGSTLGEDQNVGTLGLAASYRLAPSHTIKSQYYHNSADGDQRNASMLAVGYEYLVGSRLRLLVSAAHTRNDGNVQYSNSKGGHGGQITPAPGDDPYGLSVGLRYDF